MHIYLLFFDDDSVLLAPNRVFAYHLLDSLVFFIKSKVLLLVYLGLAGWWVVQYNRGLSLAFYSINMLCPGCKSLILVAVVYWAFSG